MTTVTTDVAVIGAGPAGSVVAARLALMGYSVCLIERARFPRRHLGESLTPGVPVLLATLGLRSAIEGANFRRVRNVRVKWEDAIRDRPDPEGKGLLVDRGEFDLLLLNHARILGVCIFQPATSQDITENAEGWRVRVRTERGETDLDARFLVDATGRTGVLPRQRRATAAPTVALYAYWRGSKLPPQPLIEAGGNEWFWGVPLPDGCYNTLVFLDRSAIKQTELFNLEKRFRELIASSGLMRDAVDAQIIGQVQACDATPFIVENCAAHRSLKVGDAALSIDPLSSSGVQKAIKSSLSAAVVINTLLRKPEFGDAAVSFYSNSLKEASEQHGLWTAGLYDLVAAKSPSPFWSERARPLPARPSRDLVAVNREAHLRLSESVEFVETPCIAGDFIGVKTAIRHPRLDHPIAFIGNHELVPLLRLIPKGIRPIEIARLWNNCLPMETGLAIADWLASRGILEPMDALTDLGGESSLFRFRGASFLND